MEKLKRFLRDRNWKPDAEEKPPTPAERNVETIHSTGAKNPNKRRTTGDCSEKSQYWSTATTTSSKHWSEIVDEQSCSFESKRGKAYVDAPPSHLQLHKNPSSALRPVKDRAWETSLNLSVLSSDTDSIRTTSPLLKPEKEIKSDSSFGANQGPPHVTYEPSFNVLEGFEEDDVGGLRAAYQAAKERIRELEGKQRDQEQKLGLPPLERGDTGASTTVDHPSKLQYVELRRELRKTKDGQEQLQKEVSKLRDEKIKNVVMIEDNEHKYKDLVELYQTTAQQRDELAEEKKSRLALMQALQKDRDDAFKDRLADLELKFDRLQRERDKLENDQNALAFEHQLARAAHDKTYGELKAITELRTREREKQRPKLCFGFTSCATPETT